MLNILLYNQRNSRTSDSGVCTVQLHLGSALLAEANIKLAGVGQQLAQKCYTAIFPQVNYLIKTG